MAADEVTSAIASDIKEALNGDPPQDMAQTMWRLIEDATADHDTDVFVEFLQELSSEIEIMLESL